MKTTMSRNITSAKITGSSVLLSVLLAGGLAFSAHAASAHGARGGGGERFVERMAERLDLDDEQLASVRAVVDEHRAEQRALRDQLREGRALIRELSADDAYDEEELRALAETHGDAQAELIVLKAKMRSEISAVLTDEQRAQLAEMGERRGRGHRR